MNDIDLIRSLPGEKAALGKNLPGLTLDTVSDNFFTASATNSGPFTAITANISDLTTAPFTKVEERLTKALHLEGILLIAAPGKPESISADIVLFVQRLCQNREFEFLTMNFSGAPTYFMLRRISKPRNTADPNNLRPLRYVLADKIYGVFRKFPRTKKFAKKLLGIFRGNR